MAATVEIEQETVTFQSKIPNQRITLDPATYAERSPAGRISTPGFSGRAAQFEGGEFQTDDPEMIAHLRSRPTFEQFGMPNAIWEKDKAPEEPKPTIREQVNAINKAARAGDTEKLALIADEERALHNRDAVLDEVKAALQELAGDGDE
jgi:hypothetical protein